jgi:hypothetical protein
MFKNVHTLSLWYCHNVTNVSALENVCRLYIEECDSIETDLPVFKI